MQAKMLEESKKDFEVPNIHTWHFRSIHQQLVGVPVPRVTCSVIHAANTRGMDHNL